jgi:phytoene dehydrogenase-like protein
MAPSRPVAASWTLAWMPASWSDGPSEASWGKGVGVVSAMCLTVRSLGGRVLAGRPVDRLLTSDGAVVGVLAGGQELRGQVVIATGGFERDPALVRAFFAWTDDGTRQPTDQSG